MNDPKRWLDDGGGATFEERDLLDAGRRAALPSGLRKRIWVGVATSAAALGAASEATGAMGAAGLGAASEASSAIGAAPIGKSVLSALWGSTAAKGVAAIAIVGSAGIGVAALRSSSKAQAAMMAHAPPAVGAPRSAEEPMPVRENAAAPSRGELAPPVRAGSAPVRASSPKSLGGAAKGTDTRAPSPVATTTEDDARLREAPADARTASRLREESAAVLAIRKTLLGGDALEALRMLDRARLAFPHGALVEEREALAVRALVASGQKELARKRGEAFLHAFPRSPHASEVRAVLGP